MEEKEPHSSSEASKYKQEGNELFASKKLEEALDRYFKSLECLKNTDISKHTELNISLHNNISLIYFKIKNYEQCITFCDNVLNIYSDNTKALLRKGQALLSLNPNHTHMQQLLASKCCFVKAKLSLYTDQDTSRYLPLIQKSLKIINSKISEIKKLNKLNKQQLYSSYFAPNPAKKINLSQLSFFESNINCICSMYAIDYIGKKNKDNKSIKFRLAPFDVTYAHKATSTGTKVNTYLQPKDLVQFDNVIDCDDHKNQVGYLHLGSPQSRIKQLYFETSNFKWPGQYTFILWIKWETNMNLITTFDSGSNAPIYVDRKHIGCASEGSLGNSDDTPIVAMPLIGIQNEWFNIKEYEIDADENKWQFVVAMGGGNKSNIYVANLYDGMPKYVGSVNCDIGEKITWRIGNVGQGPGMVAAILIFDGWLNESEMKNVYYQSRNEIFVPKSNKEMKAIRKLMLDFISLPEIVNIVIDYIRYNDF